MPSVIEGSSTPSLPAVTISAGWTDVPTVDGGTPFPVAAVVAVPVESAAETGLLEGADEGVEVLLGQHDRALRVVGQTDQQPASRSDA